MVTGPLSSVCQALESPSQKCSLLTPGEVDLDSHLPKEVWKCLFKLLFIQSVMGMTSLGAGPSEVLDRAQPQLTSQGFLVW